VVYIQVYTYLELLGQICYKGMSRLIFYQDFDEGKLMTDIRAQITTQVVKLTGDQVKTLVLNWLAQPNGTLPDFQHLLETGAAPVDPLVYGELNEALQFQPLTEDAQIQQSLEALAEYRWTKAGVPHAQVRKWLDSIGTENPVQCLQ
jgi:hypothetical protein